jgi:FdhE protein
VDLDSWLERHAFLRPLAGFCAQVESMATRIVGERVAPLPCWEDYTNDFQQGVPLLQSTLAAIDFEPAGLLAIELVDQVAASAFAGTRAAAIRLDAEQLRREVAPARRIAAWLIGDRGFTPAHPGLLRYLGWSAAARWLRPVIDTYELRRDEHRWLRNYGPTCGSQPAMAQLSGVDPGRMRFLVCSSCTTRWRYSRTGCPFCDVDSRKIAVVTVEGEGGLRLDSCESCRAYLKTYDGQGDEAVLLADWTSLHLDVVARDRGLVRRASSMFEFDSAGAQPYSRAEPTGA